ncbi:MAG TPA: metallophosphoesterase [bacterium]|nr:metallophosphoesterase [bacterium]
MRVGLISDIHVSKPGKTPLYTLKRAFGEIDLLLSAGDHIAVSVLEELETIAPLKAVMGNCDTYNNPEELPHKRVLKIKGHRIGLIHGWGDTHENNKNVLSSFRNDNVEAIVYGHTHIPSITEYEGVLIINPGSPTFPRGGSSKSVGVMSVEKDIPLNVHIVKI